MESLDNIAEISEIDKSDMLKIVEQFPKQCRDAVSLAETLNLDSSFFASISSIAVLGMGGSGIGGDLLKTVLTENATVPVQVVKGYKLPRFIGKDTLVFAVSYSGNTEETISAFSEAVSRGSRIIAVTSDGLLEKLAQESGANVIKIPSGFQPRAALGYLFFPILITASKLDIVPSLEGDINETLTILEKLSENLSSKRKISENTAKQLAVNLFGKIPVVYGIEGATMPAALRWKCQFNENSKVQAFWNFFPELNHNEIVGWELLKETTKKFSLVILRDRDEHPQITKRVKATRELIKDHLDSIYEVWCEGDSKLARILSILYKGDFVSIYLALLNGVDPTPVKRITLLKKRLAEK